MTERGGQVLAALPSCPLLGLPDDPQTHYSFAHDGHRCRARQKPAPIDATHQSSFCLTSTFEGCPLYRAWLDPSRTGDRSGIPTAGLAGAGVTGDLDPATGPPTMPLRSRTTRPRRPSRRLLPVVALLVAATVALGALAASRFLTRPQDEVGGLLATASQGPASSPPGPATSPPGSSAPATTPSAPATAPATPRQTPRPTPSPSSTPAATSGRVHVVQPGDRLGDIAAEYGTTVERLMELNDIVDPSVIEVGQEIVLPPSNAP